MSILKEFVRILWILSIVDFWIAGIRANTCLHSGTFLSGKYLHNSNLTQISNSALYSCAGACLGYTICRSFNFNKNTKTCFLNFADEISGLYLIEDNIDFVYSNIGNWRKSVAGPCQWHTCKKEEKCVVTRNGSATCARSPSYDVDYRVDFMLSTRQMTWNESAMECSGLYGNLAVADTQLRGDKIESFIRSQGMKDFVWIGATEAGLNGRWMWVDGQEMTFNMWSPYYSQPADTTGKEECLAVIYKMQTTFWDWFDRKCSDKSFYLCEIILLL